MTRTKQNPTGREGGREGGREMIASAIKVNVATAMPRENETKLALYPSVTLITVVVFLSTVKLLCPRY